MDILRFITAGSVDDGKSTLIGRLLHDSDAILEDTLEAVAKATKNKENGEIDLALVTDGLRAEREQGITIDVAYKYFTTEKRKFIIADTPGHVQYTRNMVTGASNSQLAIILVDARHGVIEQTKRHTFICALLGIPHFVVCINKMDLVDYKEEAFQQIVSDYQQFSAPLGLKDVAFIPISALKGDNVVNNSERMHWYKGKPLLQYLEEVPLADDIELSKARFQVQYVIRPQTEALHDYRGYAGKVLSGVYKVGDRVNVLPAGNTSTIQRLEFNQKTKEEAFAPMSIIMHLADDIDISRGDTIAKADDLPTVTQEVEAQLCWMDTRPLVVGGKYLLQQNSCLTPCVIKEVIHQTDVHTLQDDPEATQLQLNDIGKVLIKTANEICVDLYKEIRSNGAIIIIDPRNNSTVAAGMIATAF